MDATRWRRVTEVAADAMERTGAAREAYLGKACADDPELRGEVERLLRAHEGADDLLDAATAAADSGWLANSLPGGTLRPRHGAPAAGRAATDPTLPAELHARGARRLATVALLYAAGFVLAYAVRELSIHAIGGAAYHQPVHAAGQWISGLFVAAALAVAAMAWRQVVPLRRMQALGLAFEVVGGLGIALVSYATAWSLDRGAWGVPWLSVWIMLFPFVLPARPRAAALAAFATAAMGPLALLVWAASRSLAWPSGGVVAAITLPNFLCAALAWLGARQLHRLGTALGEAQRLGGYRLVAPLARGGMGEVWLAEHGLLARSAAIKLVRTDLWLGTAERAAAIARFEREARATASLTSPHTVRLYDFGLTDADILYYAMELLDGIDLELLVRRHGPLPPARAIHLLRQACASLQEAHERGLVHADIKPSNLFLCRQGMEYDFVKVLDFGIVRPRTDRAGGFSPVPAEPLAGTVGFLAPEAALGVSDPRTDLYALGCVGWWLVTGRPVFEATDAAAAARRAPDDAHAASGAGDERAADRTLEAAIFACLESDPARRPASAEAFDARLASIAGPAWTQRQAREWWEAHPPGPGGERWPGAWS